MDLYKVRKEVQEYQGIEYSIRREISSIRDWRQKGWLVCLRNNRKASLARLRTEWGQIRVLGNKPGEVVRGQIM